MNFRQLATFVGIYEEGSFNKAAQRLNATQSGLSMQIRNLEDSLGTPLFDRTTRGVTPTHAGNRLYATAVDILRQLDGAEAELRNLSGTISGRLRVGLMPTFTRGMLAPVLSRYLADFPNVEVSVIEAYSALLVDRVADGDVDFAVVPLSAERSGIRSRLLGTDREFLVCRPGGPIPHLSPVCLADLPPINDPDEFYDHQLEGLSVRTVDGRAVGTVAEVLHTSAGELLSVTAESDGEVLVPFVSAIVTRVSLDEGIIEIDPPEGLLELADGGA